VVVSSKDLDGEHGVVDEPEDHKVPDFNGVQANRL
jgi:hypothetical protein